MPVSLLIGLLNQYARQRSAKVDNSAERINKESALKKLKDEYKRLFLQTTQLEEKENNLLNQYEIANKARIKLCINTQYVNKKIGIEIKMLRKEIEEKDRLIKANTVQEVPKKTESCKPLQRTDSSEIKIKQVDKKSYRNINSVIKRKKERIVALFQFISQE